MQVQYRIPGHISTLGELFLTEVGESAAKFYREPLKRFESCALISSFESSLLVFPFVIPEEHKEKLKCVFEYNRQIALGQIAEELLFKSSTTNRDSLEATQIMLETLVKGSVLQPDKNKLVINVHQKT